MNELMEKENIKIENMVYTIKGQQVMIDADLAKLYETETKRINEVVKRNPKKIPERFSWILTNEEWKFLRSKISTLENNTQSGRGHYKKYLPRVFTETGIYMLSTILKSEVAINACVKIMDTFTNMRKYINDNKDIYKSISNINNKLLEHDEKINYLFSQFDKKEQLFLKGQTYSAYHNILEILDTAKENIIIIDEYADINFFRFNNKYKM